MSAAWGPIVRGSTHLPSLRPPIGRQASRLPTAPPKPDVAPGDDAGSGDFRPRRRRTRGPVALAGRLAESRARPESAADENHHRDERAQSVETLCPPSTVISDAENGDLALLVVVRQRRKPAETTALIGISSARSIAKPWRSLARQLAPAGCEEVVPPHDRVEPFVTEEFRERRHLRRQLAERSHGSMAGDCAPARRCRTGR